MRVAIRGAGGFLGGFMARRLLEQPQLSDLVGVVRTIPRRPVPGLRYVMSVPVCDVVIDLSAAASPADFTARPAGALAAEVALRVQALEEARERGASLYVLGSSVAVYGLRAAAREDDPVSPITPYGLAKRLGEACAEYEFNGGRGLDIRIGRIANAYGRGQRRHLVHDLIAQMRSGGGTALALRSAGTERRDFIHARDVAEALWAIALKGRRGGVYNVGSGRPTKVADVARELAAVAGLETAVELEATVSDVPDPGDAYPDVSRLHELGFAPSVGLSAGLREVFQASGEP